MSTDYYFFYKSTIRLATPTAYKKKNTWKKNGYFLRDQNRGKPTTLLAREAGSSVSFNIPGDIPEKLYMTTVDGRSHPLHKGKFKDKFNMHWFD